jgi:hypothetical protein
MPGNFNYTDPPPSEGWQNTEWQSDTENPRHISAQVPNAGKVHYLSQTYLESLPTPCSYTAVASDCGELLVFDSSNICTMYLPSPPPFPQWTVGVENIGAQVLGVWGPNLSLLNGILQPGPYNVAFTALNEEGPAAALIASLVLFAGSGQGFVQGNSAFVGGFGSGYPNNCSQTFSAVNGAGNQIIVCWATQIGATPGTPHISDTNQNNYTIYSSPVVYNDGYYQVYMAVCLNCVANSPITHMPAINEITVTVPNVDGDYPSFIDLAIHEYQNITGIDEMGWATASNINYPAYLTPSAFATGTGDLMFAFIFDASNYSDEIGVVPAFNQREAALNNADLAYSLLATYDNDNASGVQTSPIPVPPGDGMIVYTDGSNYYAMTGLADTIMINGESTGGTTINITGGQGVTVTNLGAGTAKISTPVFEGDTGTGGTIGAVPAPPPGSAAAGDFLSADGTWEVPPGSGDSGWNTVAPSGTMNGVNTAFTLPSVPGTNSLQLILNGVVQRPGVDYIATGTSIIYTVPPKSTDAGYHWAVYQVS